MTLGRPLELVEWKWVSQVFATRWPSQPVRVRIYDREFNLPNKTTYDPQLASYLQGLGIEMEER